MNEKTDQKPITKEEVEKAFEELRQDLKNFVAQIKKQTKTVSDVNPEQKESPKKTEPKKPETKHLKIHLSAPVYRNVYPPRCFSSAIIPSSISHYLTTKTPITPWDPPPFPDDD